jgi:hypothetical protein
MMEMDIIIALIEATSMNIMLMHRTLNLGILTLLVTHPLLNMIVIIIKNAPTLRTTASALAHLILKIIGISITMKAIDPNVIRALTEVYRMMKVMDVGHLDPPMEQRCRYSELLLIISHSGSSRNMTTTTVIR